MRTSRAFGLVLVLKFCICIILVFANHGILPLAVLFFFLSGMEYSLLFETSLRLPVTQRLTAPRLNALIYCGSAMGLLLGERVFFKAWSLSVLTVALSAIGFMIAALLLFKSQPAGENSRAEDISSPGGERNFSWGYAFAGGFLLFGGISIVYRLLQIYLRDTADISAEITALSMIVGAAVSYGISKLKSALLAGKYHLVTSGVAAGALVFCITAQKLSAVAFLPREIFIVLLLLGISGVGSCLYNFAFLTGPDTFSTTRRVLIENSWGACIGAALFGLLLLPWLKTTISFQIFIGCYVGVLAFCVWRSAVRIGKRTLKSIFILVFIVVMLVLFIRARDSQWYYDQITRNISKLVPHEKIRRISETNRDLWVLTDKLLGATPLYHRLISNAHSMSGTMPSSRRYMKLMSYLAWLYAENGERALNIGYGTGLTAQALLEFKELKRLDVIDVTRDILPLTEIIHHRENSIDPLRDNRLHFSLGGARDFLHKTTENYDLITGEPPPPANSNVSYLYTTDYYELVKSRLRPGGAFTYWVPIHSISRPAAMQILKTFCAVFQECDLYAGTETNLILVGYAAQGGQKQNLQEKFKILATTRFYRDTALSSPEQLFSLLVSTKADLATEYFPHRLLTDNHAYIEEDYTRPLAHYAPFLQRFAATQKASVTNAVSARFGPPGPDLGKIEFQNIFTVETASDMKTALPALVKAYKANASPLTIAWLFGLDENTERAVATSSLPENHYLMIVRQVVRHLQERKPAAAISHLRKFPLEIEKDKRLLLILANLNRLEK